MTDITTKLRSLASWLRQLAAHEPEPECKASHIKCGFDCCDAADEIDRLRAEVAEVAAKRDEWAGFSARLSIQLGNLLAVIHRDGGHYESEHGTEKACADAETAVHVLHGSLEGYVEANRYMKGELDDALEDARKYAEARGEIARLREALECCIPALEIGIDAAQVISVLGDDRGATIRGALAQARAELAPVEVGNG